MGNHRTLPALLCAGIVFLLNLPLSAQEKIVWTDQEKLIVEQISGLRSLDETPSLQSNSNPPLRPEPSPAPPVVLIEG